MLRLPVYQMSHLIADMARDVWHARDKLLPPERKVIYLPYRLSVASHEIDEDRDFYVHYVVTQRRWFYTLCNTAPFHMDCHDALVFEAEDDQQASPQRPVRGESWRHYAFSDCLQPDLHDQLRVVIEEISAPDSVSLWNTLPFEELRFSDSNHAQIERSRFF
tara:strand:- start:46 stop:531 length:486 start_codon:yes stop_codon:yes gene_type:complete